MQTDGIWEVTNKDIPDLLSSGSDAKKSKLLEHNVQGGLPKDIYQLFNTDKQFFADVVTNILQTNFPASIHEDILQAVGIDLEDTAQKRVRDPYFRERVLRAYEYQCAVCGFNVRVGDSLVALEAAHIKWHQAGGPDLEKNGIALCSMHHKLFDRGAFTINEELVMQVSDNAHGSHGFNEWLMAFHGNNVRVPQRGEYYPEPNFVKWHVKEVFRGYCREINGDAT